MFKVTNRSYYAQLPVYTNLHDSWCFFFSILFMQLAIANPRLRVINKMKTAKCFEKLGKGWIFLTIGDAIDACLSLKIADPSSINCWNFMFFNFHVSCAYKLQSIKSKDMEPCAFRDICKVDKIQSWKIISFKLWAPNFFIKLEFLQLLAFYYFFLFLILIFSLYFIYNWFYLMKLKPTKRFTF